MIRALAATALLVSCQPAVAMDSETCAAISQAAGSVMLARQQGMPIIEALEIANGSEDALSREIGIAMVEDAYASPAYGTDEYQQRAANEFATTVYTLCRSEWG